MKQRESNGPKVAVIEPVGGHGGMDYPDFGLCEGLSKAGADVTLYTCDETHAEGVLPYKLRLPYRQIYGSAPAWLRGLRYVRGTLWALASARLSRAQIAHFHLFRVGPLELFNVLLARLLRFRIVVTAHDVQSFVEHLSLPRMVKTAYRIADQIIAQSRVSERELIEGLQVTDDKITTIPLGNYLNSISGVPPQKEARARLGLPGKARVLLFFGQIKEVKGLDVLIHALPHVVQECPDVVLLIAGKEWKDDFDRYQVQIDSLGIADNCAAHIRYIPNSEVDYYYGAADIVVLPYRRIYQSAVLLMAMGYGKPVVASDIEGMAEVIEDGENGHLFASGDSQALAKKLVEMLSDSEELRAIGERGLSYVKEQHDWDQIGKMTADCYKAVLDG